MRRILDELKTRLGAGGNGAEIPENLRAEPADIVFYALEERRERPPQPFPTREPLIQEQMPPALPGGQQDPMMGLMAPPTPSQPTSPAQPGMAQPQAQQGPQQQPAPPAMDMSNLFDF